MLEVEFDLEAATVTVYFPGLQCWRPVVDGDVVVVELPAAVRARESNLILGIVWSPRTSFCVPLIGRWRRRLTTQRNRVTPLIRTCGRTTWSS
jgi:hypothetical protein